MDTLSPSSRLPGNTMRAVTFSSKPISAAVKVPSLLPPLAPLSMYSTRGIPSTARLTAIELSAVLD